VPLTLAIQDVLTATPRARVVRVALGGHPFRYRAGQAVLLGPHGAARLKPYSLAAAPAEAVRHGYLELLVGVDDQGRAGNDLTLTPGTRVDVEGPVGGFVFPDHPVERRFVFVAGGTGIAPLRAMLHEALTLPNREVGVFYSARTSNEFAYGDELQSLAAAGEIDLTLTVTRDVSDDWTGARGRVSAAALARLVHDPATLCFICGPPALVDETPKALAELGVPAERIRREEWGVK
jgi:ferredoxin-NADP reductase